MRLLVTGGLGFIGSHFVRKALRTPVVESVVNMDAITYCGRPSNLVDCDRDPKYRFEYGNLRDRNKVSSILRKGGFTHIVNFAAETHVDRSISDSAEFYRTNVLGTFNLLERIRVLETPDLRFLQVSTDEVYGSIESGNAAEEHILCPSSPYSASKAAADLMVLSEHKTFGLHAVITRGSNTYGTHQYPEKLIPKAISYVLAGKSFPLYGDGQHRRDWMHVDDHVQAIWLALTGGRAGEIYNVASGQQAANLDVVTAICTHMSEMYKLAAEAHSADDRRGHDFRYAVSTWKIREELGWEAERSLTHDIVDLIKWYVEHP